MRKSFAEADVVSTTVTATISEYAPLAFGGILAYASDFRVPKYTGVTWADVGRTMENVWDQTATGHAEPYTSVYRYAAGADYRLYLPGSGAEYWERGTPGGIPPIATFEGWFRVTDTYLQSGIRSGGYFSLGGGGGASEPQIGFVWTEKYTSASVSQAGYAAWIARFEAGNTISATSTTTAATNPTIAATWQHIVCERNGPKFKFFVDGRLVSTVDTSFTATLSTGGALVFGHVFSWSLGSQFAAFDMQMSSFRITCDETVYGSVTSFTPPQYLLDKWKYILHFEDTLSAATGVNSTMYQNTFVTNNTNVLAVSQNGGTAVISDLYYKFGTKSVYFQGGVWATNVNRFTFHGNQRFTVDFWINPEFTLTANSYLCDFRYKGVNSTAIESLAIHGDNSGKLIAQWGANNILTSTAAIAVGTWTHIAADRNSLGAVTMYINGNVVGTITTTSSIAADAQSAMVIGGSLVQDNGINGRFRGWMDEFRYGLYTAAYSGVSFTPRSTPYPDRGLPGKQ